METWRDSVYALLREEPSRQITKQVQRPRGGKGFCIFKNLTEDQGSWSFRGWGGKCHGIRSWNTGCSEDTWILFKV